MIGTELQSVPRERQRELVEVLQNRGELDRVGEFIHADIVDHERHPAMPTGADGVRAVFEAIRQGFPDHDAQVVHVIGEGDMVATYKTLTGTHTGNFFGIEPTGRRATIRIMDFVRYDDNLVVEHWGIVDLAGLQAQLSE